MTASKSKLRFRSVCCLMAAAGVSHAAAPDGRLFEPSRAWLERYDPTLISSRYFSEFIFESFDGDWRCLQKREHPALGHPVA